MDIFYRDVIIIAISYMVIMLYITGKYPNNYYLTAGLSFIGSWLYVDIIAYLDSLSVSIVFPVILLVLNLMITIFLTIDKFTDRRKKQ